MRRIQLTGIENSIHEKLNTSSNKVKKAEKRFYSALKSVIIL